MNLSSPLRRLSGHLLDLILAVVTLLIGWLIWSLIVWARGQTPGKQLLGMRVISSDTQAVVGWGRMGLREVICKGVIGLVAGITVIGTVLYLWLLWDDQNQELWDKMATTLVVDDPQRVLARP
ncbi:MAG TPA: RDD family protein [Gaiellales bacterium]|nr:RDD family protein [Gaiellales bacterium]